MNGLRLNELKAAHKGRKLADGLGINGRDCLTDKEIDCSKSSME